MNNEKVVGTAEKVKAFAIAFIGIFLFSTGTTYFQEQSLYRVPRILLPVYELFGNVGLAIGMLVIGLALLYWGFTYWKKHSGKSSLYWAVCVAGLVIGIVIAFATTGNKSKKDPAAIESEMEQRRQKQIDDIKNSGELNFRNDKVEKYFAEFDRTYEKYKQAVKDGNEEETQKCQAAYMEWAGKSTGFIDELNNDQKYEFSRYNAKLAVKWSEVK